MLRNMMVRELAGELHLASALSPVWVRPGKTVRVENADTFFGKVGFSIASRKDGAEVSISSTWRKPPGKLWFHIPWFVSVTSASADGKPVAVRNGAVELPLDTKKLALKWTWKEQPDLSYARAVQIWLDKNYNPKPGMDRNFLFPRPAPPALPSRARSFVDSYELKLIPSQPTDDIRYTFDGSEPGPQSTQYTKPLTIDQDTTVKAISVWPDGRTSIPLVAKLRRAEYRAATPASGLSPGVGFAYFEGDWNKLPDFAALTPTRSGVSPTFDLEPVKPREDFYAIRYTGFLDIPKEGVYTFTIGSDDGSRLTIDDVVIDNDGLHAYQEAQGEIALRAGKHPITVEYFEKGDANYLRVFWEGPGLAREHIPASALFRR
jgi:hypothetical protein